jgi:probable phosphoglycerate mutase
MSPDSLLSPPPATDCRLCLVRHGETAWNAERRLQGHIDVGLNDTGLVQAEATAQHLAHHEFAALYCSDLLRARQTAAAAARRLGMQPQFNARLRERHYGLFQGMTYAEAEHHHPELYRRFASREADFTFPEGGESLRGFAARIQQAFDDIAACHPGATVLIVTHGGVLDIAYRLASGMALERARDFGIPNAAVNWLQRDAHGWRLLAWGVEDHLAAALDELPNG